MKNKPKLLITGIGGFIGQYLTKALKHDYEIHGLYESKHSAERKPGVQHKHVCNLVDYDGINTLIEELQPDYVIHLAARTEVALSFNNYLEVSEVNYVGTVNLAEANRLFNPNLKLFVMASTMETYGHQPAEDGAFTEDTTQYPMAPYAVAKLACEKYLEYMEYAYNFPFTIIRQTNAYGRTDNDFFVMERIITQMLKGDEINLGDPEPVRNFLYIDDLVSLYRTILTKKPVGDTFVTGPDNGITIAELVRLCAEKLNWHGTVNWNTMEPRPGEIYYLNSSAKHARKVLDWIPEVSLEDGIDKTIEIWKGNFGML